MKRTILSVALLAGVLVSNASIANNDMAIVNVIGSELNVTTMDGLKFKLTAINLDKKSLVEIKDKDGVVLYKEFVGQKENYTKIFDLSYLSDGSYTFVVSSGKDSIEKPFNIQTKRIATPKN